jgi:methanogenic corrinoid protein MtbC1
MRELLGRENAPILVDQEGGRVQRLRAPNWKARPAAGSFGSISRQNPRAARDLAYDNARVMAAELCDLGINVDCTPCVDVPVEGAHNIIGDRAFANDPWVVASLGQAVIDGMTDSGVLPVIKHIPGHGRARADSHMELPVVDTPLAELERTDFVPFKALADLPWGMTAHIRYTAIDAANPATISRKIVEETIRRGIPAETLTTDVFWPTYELVCKMYRADQMSRLSHHMATRLLRVLVDQTATRFTMRQKVGRSVFAVCGPNDADELGAQMAVDLLEASGFSMTFAGGGIAGDEILGTVQERQPDVLLMFASAPGDLPEIRGMIDQIHEIGACRGLQVVVGGGVFNRAEGLAEEIGADLWATTPAELAQAMHEEPARRAATDQRTVGRKRRIVRAEAA